MRTNMLAYAIYTSGSTGRPKGAMVEHGGAVNHLNVKCAELGLGPGDTIAFTAPVAFDISVWQMLAGLGVGAKTSVFTRAEASDPRRMAELVRERSVTVLEVVPSMLRELLRSPSVTAASLSSLRCVLSTGEALSNGLAREWKDRFPDIELVNAYGPTECSDDVAHYTVPADRIPNPVPVGEPIENSSLYVLDEDFDLTPQGLRGRLFVGGLAVGRGYLNDPRRTARAFLPDPYTGVPGGRMYRTGDVVRWLEGGTLAFEGRDDSQVKIRGNRIELGELQSHFAAEPDVADAFVTTAAVGRDQVQEILAFVVPGTSAAADVEELRRSLVQRLRLRVPYYMIPSVIDVVDAFPVTPAGKVDRNALVRQAADRPYQAGAAETELTGAQREVLAVWSQVLEVAVEALALDRSFFESGGNSLSALRLLAHAAEVLGLEVSLEAFFAEPTARAMAQFVEEHRAREEEELRQLLAMVQTLPEDELERIITKNRGGQ